LGAARETDSAREHGWPIEKTGRRPARKIRKTIKKKCGSSVCHDAGWTLAQKLPGKRASRTTFSFREGHIASCCVPRIRTRASGGSIRCALRRIPEFI